MRVNDSNLNAVTTTAHTERSDAASSQRSQGTKSASGGSADEVRLSSLTSSLAGAAVESPERSARVAQLAAAYQSGRYQVDAQSLSKSIVGDSIRA